MRQVLCPEVAIAPRSTDQWDSFRLAYRKWIAALDHFHSQIEIAAARRDIHIQSIQTTWDDVHGISAPKKRRQ